MSTNEVFENAIASELELIVEMRDVLSIYDPEKNTIATDLDGRLTIIEKTNEIYEKCLNNGERQLVSWRIKKFLDLDIISLSCIDTDMYDLFCEKIETLVFSWDPNYREKIREAQTETHNDSVSKKTAQYLAKNIHITNLMPVVDQLKVLKNIMTQTAQ
ncbi:MAG: hypothetical protein L0207_05010 [Chlamydiae bacterium]|nr:hypothetical protein [Chlamydiota bacterium]